MAPGRAGPPPQLCLFQSAKDAFRSTLSLLEESAPCVAVAVANPEGSQTFSTNWKDALQGWSRPPLGGAFPERMFGAVRAVWTRWGVG